MSSAKSSGRSTKNESDGDTAIPKEPRFNQRIRAPKVRVIDAEGRQLGIMGSREAFEAAQAAGFDLVEVAPDADPPVCKFLDFGKFKYQQKKRSHKSSAHHRVHLKEVRLTPQIDPHDLDIKIKKVRELIEGGDKVVVTMRFRGRQMEHRQLGESLLNKMLEQLAGIARLDRGMTMEGRRLTMTLMPQ